MRRAAVVLAAGLALSSCSDQMTVPPDITVQVLEPVVWAGTDWVLRSPGFAHLGTIPTITLDDSAVTATVVDDSTITIEAPATGGTHRLEVRTGTQILSGQVEVAGCLGKRTALPLGGWPLPLYPGSPVMIVAAESTLVRVNAATGVAVPLAIPHRRSCLISPGPSFRASTVVGAAPDGSSAGCPSAAWVLGNPTSMTDSGPRVQGARLVVELSPGTWLRSGSYQLSTFKGGANRPQQRAGG